MNSLPPYNGANERRYQRKGVEWFCDACRGERPDGESAIFF